MPGKLPSAMGIAQLLTWYLAFRNLYTFLRYGRQKAWSAEKSASTEPKASESTSRSRFNFLSKKKFLRSIQASGFDANDDIERVYQQNRDGSVPNSDRSESRKASTTPTESQSIGHGRKRPYETL